MRPFIKNPIISKGYSISCSNIMICSFDSPVTSQPAWCACRSGRRKSFKSTGGHSRPVFSNKLFFATFGLAPSFFPRLARLCWTSGFFQTVRNGYLSSDSSPATRRSLHNLTKIGQRILLLSILSLDFPYYCRCCCCFCPRCFQCCLDFSTFS